MFLMLFLFLFLVFLRAVSNVFFFVVGEGVEYVREMADVVTRAHCCTGCCILNGVGYQLGVELVLECMKSQQHMDRMEKKNNVRVIIQVILWCCYFTSCSCGAWGGGGGGGCCGRCGCCAVLYDFPEKFLL
jgi:hypothetical protein